MAARAVVSRTRRQEPQESRDFVFSKEMIPHLTGDHDGAGLIQAYRAKAWEVFQSLPMPTTQEEAWRRTDIRGLNVGSFSILDGTQNQPEPPAFLLKPLVGGKHGGQIVLRAGKPDIFLDPALVEQGVIFTDMATAESRYVDKLVKTMGQIVKPEEGRFAALSAALSRQGVFIYVPKNVQLEHPLHSVLWGPGTGLAYFTHIVVYLEEGSSLTYVHESNSPNGQAGQTFHAGTVEIFVGDGANLRFVELQSWGEHVWNFSHERAQVNRDGNLDWIFGALGSHLTKNFSTIDLIGEGATGRMSGFYFTNGTQHLDHDTQQNHLAPHTTSDLLFKGALKDQSRSVWQGMIYVAPGAQKTDGYQANRNLVLSPKARADSIPGLEILADDVRCTHGATVGKIDPEQLFYLQSRGIFRSEAERLIVEGFFDPIMQRIPFEGVRERFQQAIVAKMTSEE